MMASLPNGEQISSVAKVDANGTIMLRVIELMSGVQLLSIDFPTKGPEKGWSVMYKGVAHEEITIPADSPLGNLNVFGISAAITQNVLETSAATDGNQTTTRPFEFGTLLNPSVKIQPQDAILGCGGGPVDCITHDLVCSPLSKHSNWPWTSDHKHIEWWAPCIGSFTVDISDCCFKHDISMWCSHNEWDLILANFNVINCIIGKVLAAMFEGLLKLLTGPCFWLFLADPALILGYLLAILVWIESTVPYLWVIMNLVFDIATPFSGDELLNKDHRNDSSCLCGGNVPTVQCDPNGVYGNCVDLCKLSGKHEDCFDCFFQCNYGADGKLIIDPFTGAASYDYITSSSAPCCPDTCINCLPKPSCSVNCTENCRLLCDRNSGLFYIENDDPTLNCCESDDLTGVGSPCLID